MLTLSKKYHGKWLKVEVPCRTNDCPKLFVVVVSIGMEKNLKEDGVVGHELLFI